MKGEETEERAGGEAGGEGEEVGDQSPHLTISLRTCLRLMKPQSRKWR